MRLLSRARERGHILEAVELALEGDGLLGPQPRDGLDTLLEARPALVHRDAERVELVGHERASEAGVEAAAADGVEHRELAGQLQRVIEDRQHGAGDHRSEEHTSELQSRLHLVCRLLLEKKKKKRS